MHKYIKSFNTYLTESLDNVKLIHIQQPDAISCGPTALQMVNKYLGIKTSIPELGRVMGTDHKSGTTDIKMIKGLEYSGLDYIQFSPINYDSELENAINNNYLILFRTKIRGVLHWVACDGYYDNAYNILDSWLGQYSLTREELEEIWAPRNHDGFIIKGKIKPEIGQISIDLINGEDINKIIHIGALIFSNTMPYEANVKYMRAATNFTKSIKLTRNGEIIGGYFVNDKTLPDVKGLGLEGIALFIKPKYRDLGLGTKLKDWLEEYAIANNYSFIYGLHFKTLHNIDSWLKRREIYAEDSGFYKTIQYLNGD